MRELAALSLLLVLAIVTIAHADPCPSCNGTGRYCTQAWRTNPRTGGPEPYTKCDICLTCNGSGRIAGTHGHGGHAPQTTLPPPGAINANCFVATAVYGNPDHGHVLILREFRDRWLLTNSAGRRLVGLYYEHGPSIAQAIREHDAIRSVAGILLLPIVAFSYLMNLL